MAQNRYFLHTRWEKNECENMELLTKQKANTSYNGDVSANIKSDSLPYVIIIIIIIVETKQMDARCLQ